jgi:hypothetical protein
MTAANITAKIDDIGTPAWIALMILGFIIWWPLGLATLAFIVWSGRMGCRARNSAHWEHKMHRMHDKMDHMRSHMHSHGRWWGGSSSSGNAAFDEYKEETLRRLEEEQKEFREFLDRLRMSKDRAEFDQFMSERRHNEGSNDSAPQPQPQG